MTDKKRKQKQDVQIQQKERIRIGINRWVSAHPLEKRSNGDK